MANSDLEELTDIRTLIDVRSVSPYSQSEDEETRIPSPYKSYTFSQTSKDSADSSDFPASPLRPDSRSARFEKIYYVSETETLKSDEDREYTQESFEAASVSERSSLASRTESELGYSDESWEEAVSSAESEDEKAEIARALQEEFIEKKLQHLRKHSTEQVAYRVEPVLVKKPKTKLPKEARQFCKKKVKLLQSPEVKPAKRGQVEVKKKLEDYGADKEIDRRVIERLKLRNLMEKMKKAASVELHNPDNCQICCCAREHNTEQSFIKMKTVIAQNKNMDMKVQDYLNNHDSITLIGELAKTLPKPTENPQQIWHKMMQGIS